MNDLDYLNQISAPAAPAKTPFLDKKFKIVFVILAIVIVLFIAISSILSSLPQESTVEIELGRLYNNSSSIISTINTYNSSIKSSDLRSAGASLNTILTELTSDTENSLKTVYALTPTSFALTSEDSAALDKTNSTLESAKLNALLDDYYASEISYQISRLLIIEDLILAKTSSPTIVEPISSSYSSLEQLKNTFSGFSETN